jgi:indole-3-glycerol phosphate synthase
MNILETIILNKRKEVAALKEHTSLADLERSPLFYRTTFSLSDFIKDPARTAIIAEFKRKSPSGGILNSNFDVEYITNGFTAAGASGLSILTDNLFFGGSCTDILHVRENNNIPILRKEFIIDEFQIFESMASGADAVLLIASVLEKKLVLKLASLAHSLDMEVLLEIHSEKELESLNEHVSIIGINNRDLKTLKTSPALSLSLADKMPEGFLKISESGISDPLTFKMLRDAGFDGFLIGECFMSKPDPVIAFEDFAKKIK